MHDIKTLNNNGFERKDPKSQNEKFFRYYLNFLYL